MQEYKIKTQKRASENYKTMIIIDRVTGEELSEYRITPGCEIAEIAGMRRALNRHLDEPGATLGNYQW